MEFDQLESQRSDLQKVLKELDKLPKTPQIELQKQEIQDRINKITDTIIKELLSKHEKETQEPTPTKEPQTTPTPCKDLVVSTPKDNAYTTYHNNANKVNLGKLSEREANLLFAIFQKLKDQGNTLIRFEPQDLKRMIMVKSNLTNRQLLQILKNLLDNIGGANFWIIREHVENGEIYEDHTSYMLFKQFDIRIHKPTQTIEYLEIQLNDSYQYLLNNLGMGGQYTSFKLLEFQRVRGKYAKTLYRLLKQYKSTGILSVEWSQFRELLDIPKDYKMENIDQKVLTPSLKELRKIYPFEHLSYKKERRNSHDRRKVTHIDFYFEQLPQGETKQQKQKDKQRAKRDIKLIAWNINNQIAKRNAKDTMEARFLELKTLIGYQFRHNDSGIVLKIDNTTFEKNQMFLHVSYPKSKHNPQKFLVSNKTFALELLYVNGYSLKKDMLEIDPPSIHPITNEPIKEFAEYIGKTIHITNFNVDQCPEGINNYLKITRIVKLNDNRICVSVQDVDKPEKLLKPFIAKDVKHLKNWFKKHYRWKDRCMLTKLIEKLNHERKNAIKNGIYHLIQIKFSYNSNRIEGSGLTYEQTAHIFDKSVLITEKNANIKLDDIFETINHFECVNHLLESYQEPLSLEYFKTLHKILKKNCSDEVIGGFKKRPNFVGNSTTTRPQLVESELTNLVKNYQRNLEVSLENIIDFHVAFEKIHPFSDGNGRVGRLVMFKECLKNNIMPFIIENEHKAFYYRGIKEYDNTKGYLKDTILQSQDNFNEMVSYFLLPIGADWND